MYNYQYYCDTNKGRRTNNQDDVAIFVNKKGDVYLLILADGMGGYNGGELASRIVIDTAEEIFYHKDTDFSNTKKLKQIIEIIFLKSREKIVEEIKKNDQLVGMGTTMSCVLIVDTAVVWGNIGDSRIYMGNGGEFVQVSKDHSLVQDYMDKHEGKIPSSYLMQYSNVLIKSLGDNDDKIDLFPVDKPFINLKDNFKVLLCSDGLIIDKSYDYSYFLTEVINNSHDPKNAVNYLINWAYNSGSTDNISVAILQKQQKVSKQNKSSKKKSIGARIFIPLILLLVFLFAGAYYVRYEARTKKINDKTIVGSLWRGFGDEQLVNLNRDSVNIGKIEWRPYRLKPDVYYLLKIKDTLGKVVFNEKVNKTFFDLKKTPNLKKGLYVINLFVVTDDSLFESNDSLLLKVN